MWFTYTAVPSLSSQQHEIALERTLEILHYGSTCRPYTQIVVGVSSSYTQ